MNEPNSPNRRRGAKQPKSETTHQKVERLNAWWAPWNSFFSFVAWTVATGLGGYGLITKTARDAVLDEKFLASLASKVRPSITFDTNGSILTDSGGSEYLESKIEVTAKPKEFEYEIRFYCKKNLNSAPIVQAIDARLMQIKAVRGTGNDWIVTMGSGETLPSLLDGGDMDTKPVRQFRAEILH